MHTPRRRLAATIALVAAAALAAGCTVSDKKSGGPASGGSIKKIDSLAGAQLKVSSKEFDEQLLLGQIALVALQAAGAKPVDKTNITGSTNVRKALTGGQVDLYWEYTGTAWVTYLKQTKVVTDPSALYDAVKKADAANGIRWWARSPANDTYAIAVNKDALKKYGTKTLSDYAALAKKNPSAASTCIGPEFKSRDDGFPGVEKRYGFTLPSSQITTLGDAVIYPTAGKGGKCNFGEVASTDGRVASNSLTPLVDDKNFFPIYNPAITIRASVAKKYPELEQVFASIAAKLDSATLTTLNKKVSVEGQKANAVARNWLRSEKFIG